MKKNNLEESVRYNYDIMSLESSILAPQQAETLLPLLFSDGKNEPIDLLTANLMQVRDLFYALNYSETKTGSATLLKSLACPLTDTNIIKAKQDSAREIEKNWKLRGAIEELLKTAKANEYYFYHYLFEEFSIQGQYDIYKKARDFILNLVRYSKNVNTKTPYLNSLVDSLQSIEAGSAFDFTKGPIYKTFYGLKPRNKMSFFNPGIKFTYRPLKLMPTLPLAAATVLSPNPFSVGYTSILMYFILIDPCVCRFDNKHFLLPLRKIYRSDQKVRQGIDALGKLDELMSFVRYADKMVEAGDIMVMPEIYDETTHKMILKDAKNPVLAKTNASFVPNDICLTDVGLTFITGPNSGGKTTYCKTIIQIQDMAQIGCYIPARHAEISIADRIYYQAPMFDSLMDDEGRFGTELKRTRDIFYNSTPKSLIVLDELAQGTTKEEEFRHASTILNAFYAVKGNTVLITHNYHVVDKFHDEGKGQCLMVEFDGEKPTYKIKEGTSRTSHAARIATNVGFSEEDMQRHLKEKGYL